jgi:hypothetical protein
MPYEKFRDEPFSSSPGKVARERDAQDREAAAAYCQQATQDGVVILWGSKTRGGIFYSAALSEQARDVLLTIKRARFVRDCQLYGQGEPDPVPVELDWGDARRLPTYAENYENRVTAVTTAMNLQQNQPYDSILSN